jgi:hypothetical protein
MAHADWITENWPGAADFVEYESRLNYSLGQLDDAVVCTYNLGNFDGLVIMDVLRAHPMVIIGRQLLQNPFYVPPDEYLPELQRRAANRSAE